MRASTIPLRLLIVISFLLGIVPAAFAIPATTISFSLDDVDISEQDGFDILNVEGCHLVGEPGQPYLPCKAVNFVIPRGQGVARVRVEVEGKERIPGNYYIYPAQPDAPGYGDDDFVDPDVDIYGSTEPFPGVVVEEGRTAMAWGWKTYQVTVWPLEYIPARREIWFNETVKISLELSPGTEDEQEILARTREQQEDWARELEQAMANPEDVPLLAPQIFSGLSGPRRWVLILPGAPAQGRDIWEDAFQPLVNHRASQGLDVEVIHVGDITGQTGEAAVQDIRLYLRNQHEDHGAQWACLVGDHEMIPWTYEAWYQMGGNPYNSFIPNDWCYCDLDGSWPDDRDWAPELWVGRIPCISVEEAENFVTKLLVYEQPPDPEYLDRVFYESADDCIGACEDVIAHQHPAVQDTHFAEQPSGSDENPTFPYAEEVVAELSTKHYNVVTVYCHGFVDEYVTLRRGISGEVLSRFTIDHVDLLSNRDYYFYWYSNSCLNAQLDYAVLTVRTLAEALTCFHPDRGAVAFAGQTRAERIGPLKNLNECAWDLLYAQGPLKPRYFNHAGSVEARSKWLSDKLYTHYIHTKACYSHNLFGDPAMGVWTPDVTPGSQRPIPANAVAKQRSIEKVWCGPVPARGRVGLRYFVTWGTGNGGRC